MNKKYKFHELVSKVTVDPLDDSDVAKSIISWCMDNEPQILPKAKFGYDKKITSKKKGGR